MPYYLDKALHYYQNKSADAKYYYALYYKSKKDKQKALEFVDKGFQDFYDGYFKKRSNYNEEIRQIYLEEMIALEKKLKNPTKR